MTIMEQRDDADLCACSGDLFTYTTYHNLYNSVYRNSLI